MLTCTKHCGGFCRISLTAWLAGQVAPASSVASIRDAHHDIVQGFAQQAARAQLANQTPVQTVSPLAVWRVDAVDIAQRKDALSMTFKGDAVDPVLLTLAAVPLRQWLGIVYDQVLRAEWAATCWPTWIHADTTAQPPGCSSSVLH